MFRKETALDVSFMTCGDHAKAAERLRAVASQRHHPDAVEKLGVACDLPDDLCCDVRLIARLHTAPQGDPTVRDLRLHIGREEGAFIKGAPDVPAKFGIRCRAGRLSAGRCDLIGV